MILWLAIAAYPFLRSLLKMITRRGNASYLRRSDEGRIPLLHDLYHMFYTCHMINFDGTNISFFGIEGPNEIKFKLASFQVKKELLQVAQLCDLFQYSNYQRIQQFSKDSPQRDMFVFEAQKNEERMLEFLAILRVAIAMPSEQIEKALADWVAFTITEIRPLLPEKARTGEPVRELPPLEEYDSLERSMAKAKVSSPYLKSALENAK